MASRLVRAAIGYGGLEVGSRAAQFATVLLLASAFSKTQFGLFYVYFSAYQLVAALFPAGLNERMTRLISTGSIGNRTSLARGTLQALVPRAILVVCLGIVALAYFERVHSGKVDVAAFVLALADGAIYAGVILCGTYWNCTGSHRKSIQVRALYLGLGFLLGGSACLMVGAMWAFFLGLMIAGLITGCAIWFRTSIRQFLRAGESVAVLEVEGLTWFVVPSLLNWLYWYGLSVVSFALYGAETSADLAFLSNMASAVLVVNSAVSQAWLSRYIGGRAARESSIESSNNLVYRNQSWLILAVAVSVCVALWLGVRMHVNVAEKYAGQGRPLEIVLFALSISSSYFAAVNSYALGWAGRQLAIVTLWAYVGALLCTCLALYAMGAKGMLLSLAFLFVFRGFFIAFDAKRRFGVGFFDWKLATASTVFLGVATFMLG